MTITIEAIYENGVLRPTGPLALQEHERVRVTIEAEVSWAERTAGIVSWKGNAEELEQFAIDPVFDPQEST
jgi:predicted DNA-binding antitoxin AbrB/MazE fold protein